MADKFEGVSTVNRQRMVYKAIWMELSDQVLYSRVLVVSVFVYLEQN